MFVELNTFSRNTNQKTNMTKQWRNLCSLQPQVQGSNFLLSLTLDSSRLDAPG